MSRTDEPETWTGLDVTGCIGGVGDHAPVYVEVQGKRYRVREVEESLDIAGRCCAVIVAGVEVEL